MTSTDELLQSFRGRSIAIVGNGPIERPLGEAIDAHGIVIRMNNIRWDPTTRGGRYSFRCVSAWDDVGPGRLGMTEFSPWTWEAAESIGVGDYVRRTPYHAPLLLMAEVDVHPEIPETPNPSTGLALAQLCEHYAIEADYYGFDHFAVGPTTHNGLAERAAFARMRYARMIT